jgi:outer membrane lipoprotein LolB
MQTRRAALTFSLLAPILIAGCAHSDWAQSPKSLENPPNSAASARYSGRISLIIQSEAVQSFSGSFELIGDATEGQLILSTPLGQIAAELRWSPAFAQMKTAREQRDYPSATALIEAATGAPLPLEALFAWLRGQSADASGWQADLSRHADGRIRAQRLTPQPLMDLRLALDP